MRQNASERKIAVVGAGVAGIVSAYLLQRKYHVTLFEKNDYVGGHTHTIVMEDGPDAGTAVDTGFIVFNNRTYPLFRRFLAELNVPFGESDMSFSYFNPVTGLQYAGTGLKGLFPEPRSVWSPAHWSLLLGIASFCRKTLAALEAGQLADLTLGEFCERCRFGDAVTRGYILPMASAIWSMPMRKTRDFPMETFARFYRNHGLLSLKDRPTWYYVKGGSHEYVKRFLHTFSGEVRTGHKVGEIARSRNGVRAGFGNGDGAEFDKVVIAAHADQALAMLSEPTTEERELLGVWRYSNNRVYLHTSAERMPPNRHAWASWNYRHEAGTSGETPASLTYCMNRLQALDTAKHYFVTLNPQSPIPEGHRIRELRYAHPLYDFAAIRSQAGLDTLNRNGPVYFCGSYFGHGFHEDAVRSAVAVADRLGIAF